MGPRPWIHGYVSPIFLPEGSFEEILDDLQDLRADIEIGERGDRMPTTPRKNALKNYVQRKKE